MIRKVTCTYITLTLLFLNLSVISAQELTLYIIPSPLDRNWNSPRSLVMTTIANWIIPHTYKKHAMGHVFVELSNENERIITGSVLAKDSTFTKRVYQGYGMGLLYEVVGGRLETTEELSKEIEARVESGKIAFIRILVSEKIYKRLKMYLEEYKRRGYDKLYNGSNQPRQGKGAGCSAFAISFLDVSDLLSPEWESEWTKTIRVPYKLIGGPFSGNKVNIFKVIRSRKWASQHEAHIQTKLYEPNFIYNWIINTWIKERYHPSGNVNPVNYEKAYGLEYDFRNKLCPQDPLFISDYLINENIFHCALD